ncbi:MAG TPA: gephyrin-like molybdotransferase receptor GlpR [Amycolatopsis sp.]|nr:gephyrin-like molybdotransferase receptor GlpR [Amycolatopsis sp.]
MPSSLIIVALAAAWLAVLVPMVVRKRQTVARTADTELAARVVRSAEEEYTVDEPAGETDDPEEPFDEESAGGQWYDHATERRYRPGRGGFDPEAAEVAARAKYSFRQRVVLILIVFAVASAACAVFLSTTLWWVHGAFDVFLAGYLGYLRRQVRIENEIRQRRLARFNSSRAGHAARLESDDYDEDPQEAHSDPVRVERGPSVTPPIRESAVVVDVDDEDPEFHELDDPGQLPFRRAVGE